MNTATIPPAQSMARERLKHAEPATPSGAAGPPEFFTAFFHELEVRDIPYVILHGYDRFPAQFASDVDYAVAHRDLPKIAPALAAVARQLGWVVARTVQHEACAFHTVVINPEDPRKYLALDVCSHFTRQRCLLVRDSVLLAEPRRHQRGFFVPSPASEFSYLLAKTLAKNRALAASLPRLRELRALAPERVQERFTELCGETGSSLEAWLREPTQRCVKPGRTRRRQTGFGPELLAAEAGRLLRRAWRPAGLHIAVLGPDGAGKSTLLENLRSTLRPCFGQQRVRKFRPDVFGRIEPGIEPAPHHRPPRGRMVSWAKIFYYFIDWWLGWIFLLLPARRRGTLVVFDRDFNDLVVDERRYLVQGIGKLANCLRQLVPRADATFILDADPDVVHARKPELPVAELERQRQAFRQLAQSDKRFRLICADQPAEDLARAVSREIILLLAAREQRRNRKPGKRGFDCIAATIALVMLSPVLAIVAWLVRWKLGSPVLFKQQRPGFVGRPFTIYKFRTMTDARDAAGKLLPDAQRLTGFGRFLRSTSLDELPELLNVLKGEMSLVGPRPLLMAYLPLYSAEQMRRHDVLPGITGWAQINGRNAAGWPQKFALDLWYVDHQSLWLDLKIIALTFRTVLRREGITQPGWATAECFQGNEQIQANT